MLDAIFELPWYIPAGIVAGGLGVFVWANRRLMRRYEAIGIVIVALGVVLGVLGYLVETPRKQVEANTRAFVKAVVAQNKSILSNLLDPEASAYNWNKEEIIDGAVAYSQKEGLTGARIIGLNVVRESDLLVSYLSVWSQHTGDRAMYSDMNSQWKLEWRETDKHWLLYNIIPLQVGPLGRDEINSRYLSRPVR